MNLNAAALRLMAEKGLTLLDVAEIVAANEVKSDTTATERQRRCRANKKAMSHRDVTRDPPNDIYSNPPEHTPIEPNGSIAPKGRKPKPSRRLPDDWQPEPLTGETAAMVEAWQPGRLERELAKFKDYWKSASGRNAAKNDWQAAWRFWLRNSDDWDKGNGTTNRTSPKQAKVDGFRAAIRQVASVGDQPHIGNWHSDGGGLSQIVDLGG